MLEGAVKDVSIDKKRINILQAFTIFCLLGCAATYAYGSYAAVYYFEGRLEVEEFNAIANQLDRTTKKSMNKKVLALTSMSNMVAMVCDDPAQWPNCSLPMRSFFNITDPLIEMVEMRAMAFAPVIKPDQVLEFEAFAYKTFEEGGYDDMGISSFGRGVSSVNSSTGTRFHDTDGPHLNNKYQILTPVLQVGNLNENRGVVMFNLYSEKTRIAAIDFMIDCFYAGGRGAECVSITDIIHLVQDEEFRPAVLVIHPMTAFNNSDKLVGLNYGVLNWDTVFSNIVPKSVSRIDIVLEGGELSYTFQIVGGVAMFKGIGDRHDRKYSSCSHTFTFSVFSGPVHYSSTVYATASFVNGFRSLLPVYALLVALSTVVVTSIIFFLHDYRLNRKALQRELVMNTKRLFVRFISHEIRTFMNIIHLGLNLLASDMLDVMSRFTDSTSEETQKLLLSLKNWVTLSCEIEESSDAATLVLNDLINYDNITLGGMTIESAPLNMWNTISATIKPFYVQARQNSIEIILNMEVDAESLTLMEHQLLSRLKVIGDPVKIVQVLRNMLSNAIKFTPTGGTVTITGMLNALLCCHAYILKSL
jgi:hypothetical protein